MVNLPTFIPPRGPTVDVSLFGSAATAGTNVGNALPTPFAAAVEGVTKGIDTAQRIQANAQNAEIRQNQIDQLPTENAIRQEQLEAAQLSNDITSMKRDIAQATQTEALEVEKAKLVEQSQALAQKKLQRDRENEFISAFSRESNPLAKKQLIFGGRYDDVFSRNPDLYKNSATSPGVYGYLNSQERDAVEYNYKKSSTAKYHEAEARKSAAALKNISNELFSLDEFKDLKDEIGIDEREIAGQITFKKANQYQVDPNTKEIIRNEDGTPKIDDNFDPNTKLKDIYHKDRLVSEDVDSSFKNKVSEYRSAVRNASGAAKRDALAEVDEEFAKKKQKEKEIIESNRAKAATQQKRSSQFAPSPFDTEISEISKEQKVRANPKAVNEINQVPVVTQTGSVNLSNNPAIYKNVLNVLGVPQNKEMARRVIAPFEAALATIEEVPDGLFSGSYGALQNLQIMKSIEDTSIAVSEIEFETNDRLQSEYSEERVRAHNKLVRDYWGGGLLSKTKNVPLTGSVPFPTGKELIEGSTQPFMMEIVKTPKELFVLQRKGYYQKLLGETTDRLKQRARSSNLKPVIQAPSSTRLQEISK